MIEKEKQKAIVFCFLHMLEKLADIKAVYFFFCKQINRDGYIHTTFT